MTKPLTVRDDPKIIHKQNGQALMILLILLVTGALTLFIHTANSNKLRIERDKKTDAALAQAKEALIGYATTYREGHPNQVFGYLPCPNDGISPEGIAASSCGAQNITFIGKLPWKTLGLPPPRDGNGECLWYTVSGNFKYNVKTDLMNWDTNGLIEVYTSDGTTLLAGNTPPERAAAVIFSPGQTMAGQNRTSSANTPECGGNNTTASYLDTDTASGISNSLASAVSNGISKMISAAFATTVSGNTTVNDKLAFITPNEIFARHIEKRADFPTNLSSPSSPSSLLTQIASCLATTASGSNFPWAVTMVPKDYGNINSYLEGMTPPTYAGRVPYNTVQACGYDKEWWDNWKDNLFYVVSKAFKSGATSCTVPSDCLTVNGQAYAAVVIFSGKKLGALTQIRNNDTDKGKLANYLEDENLATFTANNGQGSIKKLTLPTNTFNDTVICINQSFVAVPDCNSP